MFRFWSNRLKFQGAGGRPVYSRRPRFRPGLERLEDRWVPTTFTVNPADVTNIGSGTTGGLVWAINQANTNGQDNTIALAAHSTYTLAVVNNFTFGPNGLPAISGKTL